MKTLKAILKDLMGSYIFIPIFVLLSFVAIFYGYCFVAEHEIFSLEQDSLYTQYKFSITAKCKPVPVFTYVPYVSVNIGGLEILTTSVNSGYDTLRDCMNSSIKHVQILETEQKVKIYMKNGQVKEIDIIGYNSR